MVFAEIDKNEDEMAAGEECFQRKIAISHAQDKSDYCNDSKLCLDCESEIPPERLEILPGCNYCVKCQGERDSLRPKSPFQTFTPVSALFNNADKILVEDESEMEKERNINTQNNEQNNDPVIQGVISRAKINKAI